MSNTEPAPIVVALTADERAHLATWMRGVAKTTPDDTELAVARKLAAALETGRTWQETHPATCAACDGSIAFYEPTSRPIHAGCRADADQEDTP